MYHSEAVHIDNEGKTWVNDSKATNVEATYAGLVGLKELKSIVLLGGIAKVKCLLLSLINKVPLVWPKKWDN